MRLLFAHDHRFYRGPAGELYTTGTFPASAWERFLEQFDELHVIARDGGPLPEAARLARADRKGVIFEFMPSLASLRQLVFPSPKIDLQMRSAVNSADAVVARLPSEVGLLAVRHAQRSGKPYAVEVVGCAWDSYVTNGAPGARLYAPLAYLRTKRAIANARFGLYVTSSWLQRRYPMPGQWRAASNVSVQPLNAKEGRRREARLAKLTRGRLPVLGTIGTLSVKYKGIQTAIEAIARLRLLGLDLTYRLLGPGPVEPWKALAENFGVSDLVHFDGTRRAGKDVYNWLDDIDIYLQPSFTEGLPRALIEAMSRGAACIGSTCGGIPELLPAQRLHVPGDTASLAELIHKFATNPVAVAAASLADRQAARQFDDETLKKRRNELYALLRIVAEEESTA
jgi:glycosyltransferase involved in cell wall biosynthesis